MHTKPDLRTVEVPEGAFVCYSCALVMKDERAQARIAHYDACRKAYEEATGEAGGYRHLENGNPPGRRQP